jgi:hypothetical protein
MAQDNSGMTGRPRSLGPEAQQGSESVGAADKGAWGAHS